VSVEGDKLVTTSMKVASVHEKQHGHVLRDISNLRAR
jgi:phage regulator Rha-like protein